ncbi:hypothetical protein BD626DRAFT_512055, partial [Schizophyllum amplum]
MQVMSTSKHHLQPFSPHACRPRSHPTPPLFVHFTANLVVMQLITSSSCRCSYSSTSTSALNRPWRITAAAGGGTAGKSASPAFSAPETDHKSLDTMSLPAYTAPTPAHPERAFLYAIVSLVLAHPPEPGKNPISAAYPPRHMTPMTFPPTLRTTALIESD